MFDAHVWLGERSDFVERPCRFLTDDVVDFEGACESARAIMAGLDSLGVGDWQYESTGGGCFAYGLTFADGCHLLLTDTYGPLSDVGDSDDFASGGVLVGFYPPDDYNDGGSWVLVTALYDVGGEPESAIVSTVGEILQATGVSDQGISWLLLSGFIADAECASCDGSGWHGIGTDHRTECGHSRWQSQASAWLSEDDWPEWAKS